MPSTTKPAIPTGGVVFAIAALLGLTTCCPGQTTPTSSRIQNVSTESVDPEWRFSSNNVALKISEERNIPCLTPGIILASNIREGSMVAEADLLMSLDQRKAKLEVERLTQELKKAATEASTRVELEFQSKSIEVAIAELNRALQSNERLPGSVAGSEIDQLNLMVQKARAEKEKIEFQIKLKEMAVDIRKVELSVGQEKLIDHQINSPIQGVVVEVLKRPGEWVEMSEPVCRIVRLDKLRAEVKVPAEIALDNIKGSQAVFVPKLPALGNKKFPAKVIFVDPLANPVSGEMLVWVEIENVDLKLVPGLTGTVSIK